MTGRFITRVIPILLFITRPVPRPCLAKPQGQWCPAASPGGIQRIGLPHHAAAGVKIAAAIMSTCNIIFAQGSLRTIGETRIS